MKKIKCYTELAYLLGILALAFGTALMVKADFGVSMIVAPAYLLFLKLSQSFSFITFGMAEYMLQAVLLCLMIILLKQFRVWYLFSFITAVFYGVCLDGFTQLITPIPMMTFSLRLFYYSVGFGFCAMGVAFVFKTYIAPAVYELFVKEVSYQRKIDIHHFKIFYDLMSCVVSVAFSFMFFGWLHFEGIKWGTVVLAAINGKTIGLFSHFFDRIFYYEDALPLKRYFVRGGGDETVEEQLV